MAELTAPRRAGDAGNGTGTPDVAAARPVTTAPDPRAVRVRLAATSRVADEPILRVASPPEPLRMTNPTVGRGPLGGTTVADDPAPADAVLAQSSRWWTASRPWRTSGPPVAAGTCSTRPASAPGSSWSRPWPAAARDVRCW
jgi:hypothetical protein